MAHSRKELLDQLFGTFASLHQLIAAEKSHALKGTDVHRSQLEILWLLNTSSHFAIGEIAERRHISSSAATQIVDSLVEQGWVERHADPDDRRRMVIALNKSGRDQLRQAKDCILEQLGARLEALTNAQIETMISTFDTLLSELVKTSPVGTQPSRKDP